MVHSSFSVAENCTSDINTLRYSGKCYRIGGGEKGETGSEANKICSNAGKLAVVSHQLEVMYYIPGLGSGLSRRTSNASVSAVYSDSISRICCSPISNTKMNP